MSATVQVFWQADTHFWQQALKQYRADSGDQTPVRDLPLAVLSRITRTAQQLKKDAGC